MLGVQRHLHCRSFEPGQRPVQFRIARMDSPGSQFGNSPPVHRLVQLCLAVLHYYCIKQLPTDHTSMQPGSVLRTRRVHQSFGDFVDECAQRRLQHGHVRPDGCLHWFEQRLGSDAAAWAVPGGQEQWYVLPRTRNANPFGFNKAISGPMKLVSGLN